jgi:hypothetical protein
MATAASEIFCCPVCAELYRLEADGAKAPAVFDAPEEIQGSLIRRCPQCEAFGGVPTIGYGHTGGFSSVDAEELCIAAAELVNHAKRNHGLVCACLHGVDGKPAWVCPSCALEALLAEARGEA